MCDNPAALLIDPTGRSLVGGPLFDASGRMRVSEPNVLFDAQFEYDLQPRLWETATTGASSTVALEAPSAVLMTCGPSSGSSVIRQTRRYFRYTSGQSQLVFATGVLDPGGDSVAGSVRRIGYFDANNGVFFERNGTTTNVVLRNNGADTAVAQGAWNLDQCDGSGLSGFNYNVERANIFVIDLEWLGVGSVRLGFMDPNRNIVYCHEFENANAFQTTYMQTANLPLRYEIRSTGTAGTRTMRQICSTVVREGSSLEPQSRIRDVATPAAGGSTATPTFRTVLAVRPALTLGSKPNRAEIELLETVITQTGAGNVVLQLVKNPTVTGLSWSAAPDAALEFATNQTTYSGGEIILQDFQASRGNNFVSKGFGVNAGEFLGIGIDGSTPDTIILGMRSQGGTRPVNAILRCRIRS